MLFVCPFEKLIKAKQTISAKLFFNEVLSQVFRQQLRFHFVILADIHNSIMADLVKARNCPRLNNKQGLTRIIVIGC